MSASKLPRTESDSWSMMPSTMHGGLMDTATAAAGPTPCDTCDTTTQTNIPVGTSVPRDTDNHNSNDDDGCSSQVSHDSWVEVTEAELQSPSTNPPTSCSGAAVEVAAVDKSSLFQTVATAQHVKVQEEPSGSHFYTKEDAAEADEKENEEETAQGSSTVLRVKTNDEVAAAGPEQPKMDIDAFFDGLTLSKTYDTTNTGTDNASVTEREAAARVLASFDTVDSTDDFTSLPTEEQTIDLEFVLSSLPAGREAEASMQKGDSTHHQQHARKSAKTAIPTPTGATEVLRRRIVAEDWMRTLRGPSELTPQERLEVFQALFGDPSDAPISAERFKEMMVPYERHCDCLGASYGFHHRGCCFCPGSELIS